MTPVLFLYNLDNPRGGKIRRACLPLGIRTKLVPPQAHGLTLEELIQGAPPPAEGEAGFNQELLLLVDFTSAQMDALFLAFRRAKLAPVALKAALTPTNRGWTSVQLYQELCLEHEAVQQGRRADHEKSEV
jgi:hypothetical protein